MAPAVSTYTPRDPSGTVLYHVIAEHLETFLASCHDDPEATGFPAYVEREFYDYLRCGILAHGFLRLGCDTCHHELLVPFSCKRRGFCPSCAGRRMAQMAAHLVEQVIPWVPTRQWVVSVPVPLRYWMASSQDLTAKVHTIIRTTIGQYYVHKINLLYLSTSLLWWQAVAGIRWVTSSNTLRNNARGTWRPREGARNVYHTALRRAFSLLHRAGTLSRSGTPRWRTREKKQPHRLTCHGMRCPPG
jgi:hypothetical protein